MPKLLSAVARSAFGGRGAAGRLSRAERAARADGGRGAPACAGAAAEALEPRTHLSVARDAGGWTVVTPEADSRVIYVSSSAGDDGNGGRSPDRPVRTVAAGAAMVRDDSADQLLLKRGDAWDEAIGGWWKSGRGAREPIVIGAYGDGVARPRLNTGGGGAFDAGNGSRGRVDHVSLIGLHLSAHTRLPGPAFAPSEGGAGVRVVGPSDGFLVEDCLVEGYKDNVVLSSFFGPVTGVTVRRSVVVDAYSTGATVHAQGLYASGVDGLVLEENVFDHNGWLAGVAPQTMFNHNVYLQANNERVVVRGNVFAHASSHGLQARAGGRVEDNLFLDNPIGMSFGLVNGAPARAGGVAGVVNGNVFLGTGTIDGATRGWALEVGNTRPGGATLVSNNVFASAGEQGRNPAVVLARGADVANEAETVGVRDLTLRGNVVYDWAEGLRVAAGLEPGGAGAAGLEGLVVRGNDFQRVRGAAVLHDARFGAAAERWSGNRYDPGASFNGVPWERWQRDREPTARPVRVAYAEPGRTAAGYSASVGGAGSTAAFVAAARAQSAQTWRPEHTAAAVIAYVRAGYAEPGVARDWSPPVFPTAVAHLPEAVRLAAGDAPLAFDVSYAAGDAGLDAATLDGNDLRLTGRRGFDAPAALAAVRQDGARTVATYAVAPPGGSWGRGKRGAFMLVANADQVRDGEGRPLEAGALSGFTLTVDTPAKPAPPDRPPTVKKVKVSAGRAGPVVVTAWFSEDVSAGAGADDLALLAADGARLDPSAAAVTYDPAKHAATWTFPALPGSRPPTGAYRLVLSGPGITDAAGQMLDGNRDGQPGDDWMMRKPLKIS